MDTGGIKRSRKIIDPDEIRATASLDMPEVILSERFFQQAAGWEVVQQAKMLLGAGKVMSANYTPPLLKGVVVAGESSVRAGLVIQSPSDIENLCPCRDSRDRGIICAHSVALGLQIIQPTRPPEAALAPPGVDRRGIPQALRVNRPPLRPTQDPIKLKRSETGEPLKIHVIFPPNLAAVIAKGGGASVLLVFEGVTARGRQPLNTFTQGGPFRLAPEDVELIEAAELACAGDTPGMAQLPVADLLDLLPKLVGHPRVTLGRHPTLTVRAEPFPVPLLATLELNGEITLGLKPGTNPPPLLRSTDRAEASQSVWGFVAAPGQTPVLAPVALLGGLADLLVQPRRWPRAQVPSFLSHLWPALMASGTVTANFRLEDFTLQPMPPKFLLGLDGGLAQLTGTLQCAYGSRIMTLGVTRSDDTAWIPDPTDMRRYGTRNTAAEQGAMTRLRQAGFTGPDGLGLWQLPGQDRVLRFFARDFARLEQQWQVTLEARLERSTQQNLQRVTPEFRVTPSGERWFDLEVSYRSGDGAETFSASEIQQLLRGGGNRRLKSGKFALLDTGAVEEMQEVLLDCAPQQSGGQGDGQLRYRMTAAQAGFLESSLAGAGFAITAPPAWRERVRCQTGVAELVCPPLGVLESVLRPYQKQGVGWLRFLRENNFGGVLADEMGLGKTLQILAHFAAVRAVHPGLPPALVVCPTTLVFNWAAEANKFTPHLKVLVLEGPQRHRRFELIADQDIVVTSYALIRRDADRYPEVAFDTVVLDEAQHIKNRRTQNAVAVKRIRGNYRLIVTGTPLENSVLDLWSLFDFLMPSYLGNADDFRERYEVPIAKERDTRAMARLGRRIRPFLLRRLKKDVAAELPAKLEQVAYCELTAEQAALYQQLLMATRKEVFEAVGEQGLAKSRMLVLTALLRLRQVCCDVRLLAKPIGNPPLASRAPEEKDADESAESAPTVSGKVQFFTELLDEILDGGHRVLVFSQFSTMLGLLREQLTADGTSFCYLDGSTANRGEVVERFQKDPTIPVFLISLKAGGVGLNLTGADTVIHFDPWWNPAVEDQATDRAHRIGQSKLVTSYNLITRGTVEEKILALQERKRAVIAATLTGEEAFTGSLSWDEIQELLG